MKFFAKTALNVHCPSLGSVEVLFVQVGPSALLGCEKTAYNMLTPFSASS